MNESAHGLSHAPIDYMRQGLEGSNGSNPLATKHAVEKIQNEQNPYKLSEQRKNALANVYGIALPAQMDIERQILAKVERLPNQCKRSKRFGLEILSGNVDKIGFEDYLGLSETRPESRMTQTTHEIMEQRLGLGLSGPRGR